MSYTETRETMKSKRNDHLEKVKQLLLTVGWTQEAYAEDAKRYALPSECINNADLRGEKFGEPVCFCIRGAVIKTMHYPDDRGRLSAEFAALDAVAKRWEFWLEDDGTEKDIVWFNDNAESVAEITTLIDQAKEEFV